MDSLFGGLKKLISARSVNIDDVIFRLHYRATFVVLLAFSIMVTGRSFWGDPIKCISKDDIPEKVLQTFCWIHTTYSIESAWKKPVGLEVPYPGVDNSKPNEKRIYHAYYQWVCFVLFFQALAFYIPRFLWKRIEGERVKNLTAGLVKSASQTTRDNSRANLVLYMFETLSSHSTLFLMYIIAEIMNFLNVIIQMILMDKFLGNEFSTYGLEVLKFTDWDWNIRYDPMLKIFPRLTKCTFRRYGSSGDVQKHDAMCILPVNIVNEKIYIFLWFWFCLIALISLFGLVYRLITLFVPRVRQLATYSRRRITDLDTRNAFERIVYTCGSGTWFFLDLISRNVDSKTFKQIILDFNKKLEAN